ncbi:MAG: hypothetical protein WBA17_07175 [Saprospiraceae bacterium]
MRHVTYLFATLLLGIFSSLPAQVTVLDGDWQGTITVGGLDSPTEYPIELYLVREGSRVTGRSYITIAPGQTIIMDLAGYLYQDFSILLHEVGRAGNSSPDLISKLPRKYQIRWHRRATGSGLEGFWQEIMEDDPFNENRDLGRLKLARRVTGA